MLYPQRLFNMTLPRIKKIVDGDEERKGTKKAREGEYLTTAPFLKISDHVDGLEGLIDEEKTPSKVYLTIKLPSVPTKLFQPL